MWQEAELISADSWQAELFSGQMNEPESGTFAVGVRAIDMGGRSSEFTVNVPADAVEPQVGAAALFYANGPITGGDVIDDIANPTVTITWTEGIDASGIARYWVGFTGAESAEPNELTEYASGTTQHAQQLGEAQRYYAHIITEDSFGNQTRQVSRPFIVDYATTPALAPMNDRLTVGNYPYDGWLETGCNLIGADERAERIANGRETRNVAQQFFTTWDAHGLRLTWTGANWNYDGDLFIYLDTAPGGTERAYDPFPATMNDTLLLLPLTDFAAASQAGHIGADYLVWVENETDATLLQWSETDGWQSVFEPPTYKFLNGKSDLYLPFTDLGIVDPASASLGMVAFATEEDGLYLWSTMPENNPLNSERMVGTMPIEPVQFMLTNKFGWQSLGDGVCPNGQLPTARAVTSFEFSAADVRASISAEPAGTAYSLLGNNLFFAMDGMFPDLIDWESGRAELCSRNPDARSCQPHELLGFTHLLADHIDMSQPRVANGDTIAYSLDFTNDGAATAESVQAQVKTWGQVRLNGATTVAENGNEYDILTLSLGDLAPGETRSIDFTGYIDTAFDTANNENWATLDIVTYDATGDPAHNFIDWLSSTINSTLHHQHTVKSKVPVG